MKLLDRFIRWRLRRRHLRHSRWLRNQRIVFTFTTPARDDRDWLSQFKRTVKKDPR